MYGVVGGCFRKGYRVLRVYGVVRGVEGLGRLMVIGF